MNPLRLLVLTLLWLVWATLAKHFVVAEPSGCGWMSASHLWATSKPNYHKKIWMFLCQSETWTPLIYNAGWAATRPSWWTAPNFSATEPRCLQPQTITTAGMKNTRYVLRSSERLLINLMSQTWRNFFLFFFTQWRLHLKAHKCWRRQLPRSRAPVAGATLWSEASRPALPHGLDLRSERMVGWWCGRTHTVLAAAVVGFL